MVGKHHLEIANKKVKYSIDIERKVTVIKGDSGTGKTTLIRMIQGFVAQGNKSGIIVKNDTNIPLVVFDMTTKWELELEETTSKIIFIDEAVDYIYSKLFQEEVAKSQHYLVVISRSGQFNHLPYAISSIYKLCTEETGDKTKLTKLYRLYEYENRNSLAEIIISEDSNSGAEMMQEIFSGKVISAYGNGNVANELIKQMLFTDSVFTIVDGAAFGGFIARVMNIISLSDKAQIFAPESFEYLLLQTDAFKRKLEDQLENTWRYCDISKYLTWERYYTELLQNLCEQEYGFTYTKAYLHKSFLNDNTKEQVKEEVLRCCVEKSKG